MFAYDTDGKVYRVSGNVFQNIGIVVGDKHSTTIQTGKQFKKIDEAGRVATIEEIIAKFHVSPENPVELIQQTRRSVKR